VEGGKIDHASHHNDAYGMVSETLAFDQAIGAAVRLVNEQDTLLVITADHETGGLSLNGYRDLEITKGKKFINQQCVITSDPLVTWASGPKHKDNQADICMDTPATFYRQSAAHTAVDVPIISKGPGSQRFTGFIDNEDVAWLILRTLGTEFSNPVNHENYRLFRK
jgi:alkaline phosphatase